MYCALVAAGVREIEKDAELVEDIEGEKDERSEALLVEDTDGEKDERSEELPEREA